MTTPDDGRPWEHDPYVAVLCAQVGRLFAIGARLTRDDPAHDPRYAAAATDPAVAAELHQAQAEHVRARSETYDELVGVRRALALYLGMPADEGRREGRAHQIAADWWRLHYPDRDGPSASDVESLIAARQGIPPAGPRAGVALVVRSTRQVGGASITRATYAEHLRRWIDEHGGGERLALVDAGEAHAVAALLDELAALCPADDLGRLARELAVRINDRSGV